jgi:hypothetical protein
MRSSVQLWAFLVSFFSLSDYSYLSCEYLCFWLLLEYSFSCYGVVGARVLGLDFIYLCTITPFLLQCEATIQYNLAACCTTHHIIIQFVHSLSPTAPSSPPRFF